MSFPRVLSVFQGFEAKASISMLPLMLVISKSHRRNSLLQKKKILFEPVKAHLSKHKGGKNIKQLLPMFVS